MAAVGLAFEDQLVGGGLQPVDGGLGQQGIGHLPQPLIWNWHRFVLEDQAR